MSVDQAIQFFYFFGCVTGLIAGVVLTAAVLGV
jgi:hypothetical protein